MNRKGLTLTVILKLVVIAGLLIPLFIGARDIIKERKKNTPITFLPVTKAQDCEQFWEKALEHQEKSKELYYGEADLSTSNSLLYQNCLKRFERK